MSVGRMKMKYKTSKFCFMLKPEHRSLIKYAVISLV